MSITAQTLELLIKAGVEGDSLVEIVRSMEAGAVRSPNAERQARYRERQRNVTNNVTPVTQRGDERGNIDTLPSPDSSEKERKKDIAALAQKRGTRLPDDWQPPANCIEWWRSRSGDEQSFHDELDKFRDWARAASGSRGVKRDWDATFRNWLRNAIERRKGNGYRRTGPGQDMRDAVNRVGKMVDPDYDTGTRPLSRTG